ncbi:MAG TPA: CAP domain-containing protein [Hellea balneolensis]|uniref:CAP domain-containing protein n=1 Tax=Hellea balneolensis TaxID=287478 RepID=A0A7C5R408_9PROT|nr:CAP domain-containing protein [Hellea balneolensis]
MPRGPYSLFALLLFLMISGIGSWAVSQSQTLPDDGTYRMINVSSFDECSQLCSADKKCRGAIAEQPDITKPLMICRLNDGFGAHPAFPSIPPKPLDMKKALADLNAYRARHGLKALSYDERLNRASEVHATDLAIHGIISHTGTDGSAHGDRVHRQGYEFSIAGENVATGQKSWEKVFSAWQKSPGHNENLLRDDVTHFGLALVYEPTTTYQTYWAMLVAAPLELGL